MSPAECNKATQSEVEIQTDIGPQIFKVPANDKEVRSSPHQVKWVEAERVALDVILHHGNSIVSEDVAWEHGCAIHEPVTIRKLKVNASTGMLESHNGFKARHAYNPNHSTPLPERFRGSTPRQPEPPAHFAGASDDMLCKMFFSDAACAVVARSTKAM